ncbi:hypothetical protein GMRT_12527 [Giardia muris]|uniref:RING-type domain-containing protein n=1 Tax=Giardia muris TaxID=5742 RepID=A0A4Z1STT4_GIAMU|nr:hypothetical protein GMRT_12527 [Giardia muris]|eukprot:TNJ28395.1 hypothetical protein GMRT_12527 [Giardia muris]
MCEASNSSDSSYETKESSTSSDSGSSHAPPVIDLSESKFLRIKYSHYLLCDAIDADNDQELPTPKNEEEEHLFENVAEELEPARKRFLAFSNHLLGESVPYGLVESCQRSLRSSLQCPVCTSILHDPYSFADCGHSVCRACLFLPHLISVEIPVSPSHSDVPKTAICPICTLVEQGIRYEQSIFSNRALQRTAAAFLATTPNEICGDSSSTSCTVCNTSLPLNPETHMGHLGTSLEGRSDGSYMLPEYMERGRSDETIDLFTLLRRLFVEQDVPPEFRCTVCARAFCSCLAPNSKKGRTKDSSASTPIAYELNGSKCARLCRPIGLWTPDDVDHIVGKLSDLAGNREEVKVLEALYGDRYTRVLWERFTKELLAKFTLPFYPVVEAEHHISLSTMCCYRCLPFVVNACCTFYRGRLATTMLPEPFRDRPRCLCGIGCRLQFVSATHAEEYEHAGLGCRGDQGLTIFGSST